MTPLGELKVAEFLQRHWQKKPVVVRDALPECPEIIGRDGLLELAERDHLESRLVERSGRRWRMRHGPFDRRVLKRLPRSGWTLLVQGVDAALPADSDVGAHFDNYDVFLLQGEGRRRWRAGAGCALSRLPPGPAAPRGLVRGSRSGAAAPSCEDRGGHDAKGPEIPGRDPLERRQGDAVPRLSPHGAESARRDPRPARPLPEGAFAARAARDGLRLSLQMHMLFHEHTIFINGEAVDAGARAARVLARLDHRSLPPRSRIDGESAHFFTSGTGPATLN